MTRQEAGKALAVLRALWPHSSLGEDAELALNTWQTMLADATFEEASKALYSLAAEGREHAPPVGVVANRVARSQQPPPPPFEEVGTALMRAQHWLPYDPEGRFSPDEDAEAIRVLAARGVHEAVLRFVQQVGLGACYRIKWGERGALDKGEAADLRDRARAYSEVVRSWQSDPRRGVALERAERVLLSSAPARPALGA